MAVVPPMLRMERLRASLAAPERSSEHQVHRAVSRHTRLLSTGAGWRGNGVRASGATRRHTGAALLSRHTGARPSAVLQPARTAPKRARESHRGHIAHLPRDRRWRLAAVRHLALGWASARHLAHPRKERLRLTGVPGAEPPGG